MSRVFGPWLFGRLLTVRGGSRYARLRLVRSALLIAIVMVPLVLALIFMDGMMNGITEKYIMLQDGHLQIHEEGILEVPLLETDPDILSTDYVVSGYGIVYSRDATAEVRIKGVDESYFNPLRSSQLTFEGAPPRKEGSVATVMLSRTVAKTLGVGIGDRVAFMVVPDSSSTAVRPVLAQVVALYDSGYHELDSSLVFMNREDALRYFPKDRNAYTEILVRSTASSDLVQLKERIDESAGTELPYATWDEFNGTVYQNFITSRQVILLVFTMILLVAGVYVASIAQEMVQDSMQSIALFKTMGATSRELFWSFFFAVMVMTVSGMAIGVLAGIAIGSQLGFVLHWLSRTGLSGLQYYLLDFPVVVSWYDILVICMAMVVISCVTVQVSLRRIRKISPLELLQQD